MNSIIRKLVFFVALIGLAFVSHIKMIKPANAEMERQEQLLADKKAQLEKLQNAPEATQELQAQLDRLSSAIEFFESKLPPASKIDSVLQDVAVIARRNNLNSKTIKTIKTKHNNGYIELPIKMELDGNFNSFYSFLLELEQLDRITKIREITLNKDNKKEGEVSASFVLSIFFQDAFTK